MRKTTAPWPGRYDVKELAGKMSVACCFILERLLISERISFEHWIYLSALGLGGVALTVCVGHWASASLIFPHVSKSHPSLSALAFLLALTRSLPHDYFSMPAALRPPPAVDKWAPCLRPAGLQGYRHGDKLPFCSVCEASRPCWTANLQIKRNFVCCFSFYLVMWVLPSVSLWPLYNPFIV